MPPRLQFPIGWSNLGSETTQHKVEILRPKSSRLVPSLPTPTSPPSPFRSSFFRIFPYRRIGTLAFSVSWQLRLWLSSTFLRTMAIPKLFNFLEEPFKNSMSQNFYEYTEVWGKRLGIIQSRSESRWITSVNNILRDDNILAPFTGCSRLSRQPIPNV